MNTMNSAAAFEPPTDRIRKASVAGMFLAFLLVLALLYPSTIYGQGENQLNVAEGVDEITQGNGPVAGSAGNGSSSSRAPAANQEGQRLSLLSLLTKGGLLMVPIGVMSILVIAIVIERLLSLRACKVLPGSFVEELGVLAASTNGFDPKQAYRVCQEFPSSASSVIRAMLLKVGRPQAEVERAVAEASDREASRLYGNVRWLNLIAAVAPLVGLFGTVWGMIQAFFQTTQLTAGQNKSLFLAEGIYVALVTTLGGLAVAIPAAVFSHYFEGRIQGLFFQIDELMFNLMPQIERFEGRLRMSRSDLGEGNTSASKSASTATGPGPVPVSGPASAPAKAVVSPKSPPQTSPPQQNN